MRTAFVTHNVSFTHATRSRIRLWEFSHFRAQRFPHNGRKVHVGCLQRSFSQRSIDRDGERLAQSLSKRRVISVFARFALKLTGNLFLPRILNLLGSRSTDGPYKREDFTIRLSRLSIFEYYTKFCEPRYPRILRFKRDSILSIPSPRGLTSTAKFRNLNCDFIPYWQ